MNATYWTTKGKESFMEEDYVTSKQYFRFAIEADPDNGEAYAFLAASYGKLMESGGIMEKLKYLPQFEKTISTALRLDPESTVARRVNAFRLMRTPKEFGGNPKKAVCEFLFCIEKGIQDSDIYYGLGLTYIQLKEYSKAKEALEKGIDLIPQHALIKKELEFVNGRMDNVHN
ncbi:tetratricopeptide (TPR) repeat protein [Sporosarcina luteola]|nr:tetratricopeptide (TPR) repeat protein [Sporosarcina luteola]